jgi:ribonuclease G|tara:strand:- start:1284 stop:2861 length:1578 start_codon:yes stop_codon:yes gene_type:complete
LKSELIINSTSKGVELAVLEEGKLVELHRDPGEISYRVGDIYLGRVRKVLPNLNAGFIDVGYDRDAFLHHSDLGVQFKTQQKWTKLVMSGKLPVSSIEKFKLESKIDKKGQMKDYVSSSQLVMVQVSKEPISTKGPRLTAEVTLPGRFLVLVPFSDKVNLSSRIKSEKERNRLSSLIKSIRPPGFGIIVRTVAQEKGSADLHSDLSDLMNRWEELFNGLKRAKPGKRILGELNKTSTVLRDALRPECELIRVNDETLADQVKTYLGSIGSDKVDIVKFTKDSDLFNTLSIHRQIKATFGKKVNLQSGAYLIIEQTEAMFVIDVNSGGRKKGASSQEENALQTNIECVEEIARLLRLRDIGGIVAIDFIDMAKKEHNKQLTDAMKLAMKVDKAKHNIAPPSKFGVIELTRQRVRDVANVQTQDRCPSCNGTGAIQAAILVTDTIKSSLKYLSKEEGQKKLTLFVHPILEAYLLKGEPIKVFKGWFGTSIRIEWEKELGLTIELESNSSMEILEFNIYNARGEELTI